MVIRIYTINVKLNLELIVKKKIQYGSYILFCRFFNMDWAKIIQQEVSLDGPLSLFEEISYDDSQTEAYKDYVNAAHGMIYARDPSCMKLEVTDDLPRPKHALILVCLTSFKLHSLRVNLIQ